MDGLGNDLSSMAFPSLQVYKAFLQCAVQSFSPIALWVIGGCSRVTHTCKLSEGFKKFILKFPALIVVEFGRVSKLGNGVIEKPVCCCFGGFVPCGVGLHEPSEWTLSGDKLIYLFL